MNVYLDNAATLPISNSVKDYISEIINIYGNPSSLHSVGELSKDIIKKSRKRVADFINAKSDTVYFTSGGAASNTLAIKGYCNKNNCCVLYSPIAHKSIIKSVASCKNSYSLKVDIYGNIDTDDLKEWLESRSGKFFVIVDYANSEIGTIQNVKKIVDLVHFYNGVVYLDCTGSISQIELNVNELDIDMAGFSAHKLGGLKGCGVLYKKSHIQLEPLIYGSQEQGLVGGTENTLGIAVLGKVIEDYDYSFISSKNRDYVYAYIKKNIQDSYLIGANQNRLPHNLYLCFKNISGESLMLLLDMNDVQVSTGSACNGGNLTVSQTLSAIKLDNADIYSCIRMTFSGKETKEELDYVCTILKRCVDTLRNI